MQSAIASCSLIKWHQWPRSATVEMHILRRAERIVRPNEAEVRGVSRSPTSTTRPLSELNTALIAQFKVAHRCRCTASCSERRSCARNAFDVAI